MALFTKDIKGIIITDNDEPVRVEINIEDCLRGR